MNTQTQHHAHTFCDKYDDHAGKYWHCECGLNLVDKPNQPDPNGFELQEDGTVTSGQPEKTEAYEKTLGHRLGEIVSRALAKELDEHRWFNNFRTLDERDQWTVEDFHGLNWREQLGTVGSLGIDVVIDIKEDIQRLLDRRELATLERLITVCRRDQSYEMEIRQLIEAIKKRLGEE